MYIYNMDDITPERAYIAGFLIGDGNLSSRDYLVRAVEENAEFIKIFAEIFRKAFNQIPKIYFDTFNNSFVAYIHSKSIWLFFVEKLGIPPGNKSRRVRIPELIFNSPLETKVSFLSGLFDAEGSPNVQKDSHHPNGYPRIEFKVTSRGLIDDVSRLLSELSIKHNVYQYENFSMLGIYGREQCRKFIEIVGFKHPVKNRRLKAFL